MAYETSAQATHGGAAEAFAMQRGDAGEFAHVFIACARWLEIPARFVSGYLASDSPPPQGLFAWAEAEALGDDGAAWAPAAAGWCGRLAQSLGRLGV